MPPAVDDKFRELVLPGAPLGLELSSDGARLACATMTDRGGAPITVIDTADGSVVARQDRAAMRGRGVAFVAGGRELVFLLEDSGNTTHLLRAALDSDSPAELQTYSQNLHNHAIVRDRKASRYAVLGNQVEIRDAASNDVVHTLPGASRDHQVHAMFSPGGERIYVYGSVEKAVVCYEVASAKETARWDAPTPFGAQVVVTPDERFVLAAGTSHKGLFLHDLTTGERVMHDKAKLHTFDSDALWAPFAVAHDSSVLACLRSAVYCLRLPAVEDVTVRKAVIDRSIRSIASASAWDAPVIAFGTREDATVRWFQLLGAGA